MWLPETENLLKEFSTYKEVNDFAFCGGSALSYYLKHRYSEDVDFFSFSSSFTLDKKNINRLIDKLKSKGYKVSNTLDEEEQMDFYINKTKTTFCSYPKFSSLLEENSKPLFGNIKITDIGTLIAMKADASKSREKIRDYYDLYAVSKELGFKKIIDESLKADPNFNVKLFIKRLVEMDDKLRDVFIEDYLKPKYSINKVSIRLYFEKEADNYIAKEYMKTINNNLSKEIPPQEDAFTKDLNNRLNKGKGGPKR
ncbi:MAG: nucleotidyl transferase AbiEii/AbiGii toxin family protein [Deltaproteobacteria bacterium]|jgi:predicted nucleotidyltransferase component of viral defense system|nr:nucleotidyl transferase AbiEii/AbiGii toxin family protein [Deltaproteobacteria bacterium]MCL5880052.1 nucleotidyl transferase AbiEii/AbiGii toxin family protein [Deltaproteobacteria bacterium]